MGLFIGGLLVFLHCSLCTVLNGYFAVMKGRPN